MNESETRAELIDPLLAKLVWGRVAESRVLREFPIANSIHDTKEKKRWVT